MPTVALSCLSKREKEVMAIRSRINDVLKRITKENLDMKSWGQINPANASCGTTMCFAGHAAVAGGKTLKWEPWESEQFVNGKYETVTNWRADYTTDGELIEDFAQSWLGLDDREVGRIFFATGINGDVELLKDHVSTVIDRPWEKSKYERSGGITRDN